jgi:zinc transport system substrate-binding protein
VDPAVAEALAREVGAEPAALSPLEVAPETGDYFTRMRENLAALRQGLGC